ncbi:GNAT family N-acetyltransferase [Streptomyces iconiensis]|uniref:GNAT family N-acetyltransferase n=1 Tax=Streptomyces iconiensis TaxID=1384038 RepID=A0ABT7A458_9ACTN|nr:GNAT family N-acetyltransferase [Streptomyces iconiensis]MDJ1136105.1 GNAT family N-acetyltransferase [Streptomyces iconiensis]
MTQVRRATPDDIAELTRLRALLFETLDGDFFNSPTAGEGWRDELTAVLKEQFTAENVRILVVDSDGDGDGGSDEGEAGSTAGNAGGGGGGSRPLAACGIGTIEQRLPGPHLRNGRIGQVVGVVTDPAYRRRGHSRALMQGLLDWFKAREIGRVDLYASSDGEPLYRALGFTEHPDPALCWRP